MKNGHVYPDGHILIDGRQHQLMPRAASVATRLVRGLDNHTLEITTEEPSSFDVSLHKVGGQNWINYRSPVYGDMMFCDTGLIKVFGTIPENIYVAVVPQQ